MAIHLLRDLERLKKEILALGSLVEQAIRKATIALVERRSDLAEEVIQGDRDIDAREVAIEEECLKVLALHQPVAADLRFIITTLKVNNDLERMGDLASNIAARARHLAGGDPLPLPKDFGLMVDHVRSMVRDSLDALVTVDTDLARSICAADSEVDELHRKMFVHIQELMRADPASIEKGIQVLSVSRHLERIADLATNIAEDVEFMVVGKITRHRQDPLT